jgi:hypothetical protein
LVRAGYEDLIALRDKLSPGTHLVFQGYDFAIPDGRGICHFGPWLKPTFDLRKFPTLAARQVVVKAMLQQFAATLTSLPLNPRSLHQRPRHAATQVSSAQRIHPIAQVLRNSPTSSMGAGSSTRPCRVTLGGKAD